MSVALKKSPYRKASLKVLPTKEVAICKHCRFCRIRIVDGDHLSYVERACLLHRTLEKNYVSGRNSIVYQRDSRCKQNNRTGECKDFQVSKATKFLRLFGLRKIQYIEKESS